jgi:ribose transport system ATP-binding protein
MAMVNDSDNPIVRMTGICKQYPGVAALDQVNFKVRKGEIRALLGENGAGKSTLIKILTGAETPTSGDIWVEGHRIAHMSPALSEQFGIACVYQNLILAEHLTVAENVWMGAFPSRFGFVSRKELARKTRELLTHIGYADAIDPTARVSHLNASQQGMVAIVRAISREARVVIFDEPTAVLAEREVDELFRVIRLLKEKHLAVIYISHRLEEIFELCDTISVLKDGKNAGETVTANVSEQQLIALMVGREVSLDHYDSSRRIGAELLRVESVSNERLMDCSITVHQGEIVGLYGLVGAGRTEFSRAMFGADPITKGTVNVSGKVVALKQPRQAIDRGMSLVPEDRRRQGLAMQLSVRHNLNLPVYRSHSWLGFVRLAREREVSDTYVRRLSIRTPSGREKVKNLSGGNQQKVVLGKWLANQARIFIMDEPTNGIDVGARQDIYALINQLAHSGSGVICISSYLPELMGLCDRILIMKSGRTVADVPRSAFNEEYLLRLAIKATNDRRAEET